MTIHHIIPRKEGGGNHTANLITLCRFCHDEIEILGLKTFLEIKGYNTRKYIKKDPLIVTEEKPLQWQQWVYGGYKRPK